MMDTELFEDLTRKEDQSRLNRCKYLFDHISEISFESHIPEILNYLHDTWSVIRTECGKQLVKIASYINDDFISTLLVVCKSSVHWQEIHGSILGLAASVSVENGYKDQAVVDSISELCLNEIGHINVPVKEAARDCLINIQKQRQDKSILLHKIVELVDHTAQASNSDSEAAALQLDGLLGCLADTYHLFPELILCSDHVARADSALEVAKTMRICALHPASTVRQKAGQIITLFMLTFLRTKPSTGSPRLVKVPPVVKYITNVLTEALEQTDREQWCLQEISLMVAEELVRVVIDIQLEVLGSTAVSVPVPSVLLKHTFEFMGFLKNHISVLLGHNQFEVRRMAIQLIPQLARAFVLLNASFGSLSAMDDVDFLSHEENLLSQIDMSIVFPTDAVDTECIEEEAEEFTSYRDSIASEVSREGDAVTDVIRSEHSLQVPLNCSFRSVHAAAETSLDLPLIARMVWLAELIKENQHLFEAYAVSDTWASNSVTQNLQMRTHSIKDSELHKQLADYATQTSQSSHHSPLSAISQLVSGKHNFANANANAKVSTPDQPSASECPRGVVDHWSLDVRGRLQELEKRAQFHRTVRGLVAAEVLAESSNSKVAVLLLQNCRTLVGLAEEIVLDWERLFSLKQRGMDFMATLSSLHNNNNNNNSTAPVVGGVTLSIDLVECFVLVDSFLLSVQYRFAQCPDIEAALSNLSNEIDPEVEMLQSAATILRGRLNALSPQVIKYIARIQCVGRSSTHISSRSGVTGHSPDRVPATQALLRVTAVFNHHNAAGGIFEPLDEIPGGELIVGNKEEAEEEGVEPSTGLLSDRSILNILMAQVHAKMSVADTKNGRVSDEEVISNMAALEDVLLDIYSDRVLLIGSVTNAFMNLGGVSSSSHATQLTHSYANAALASEYAYTQSPGHTFNASLGGTPLSSSATFSKNVLSQSVMGVHSPTDHTARQFGNMAHPGSVASLSKFLSMDQWNCEAVSPLLTCLANATHESTTALELSCIVVEWCAACSMNPLWLDCRHNAKKNLFESLVLLLTTAEKSKEPIAPRNSVYVLVLLKIVRAVTEILSLRSTKPPLELKTLMCLVKAATAGIKVCMRFQSSARDLFVQCAAASPAEREKISQAWRDFQRSEVVPKVQESSEKILQSWTYYSEVFPLPSAHRRPSLSVNVPTGPENSTTINAECSDTNAEASVSSSESSSEEEFSDWDEESDIDADEVPTTDFNASGNHVNTLVPILWEDMSVLKRLLGDWSTQ